MGPTWFQWFLTLLELRPDILTVSPYAVVIKRRLRYEHFVQEMLQMKRILCIYVCMYVCTYLCIYVYRFQNVFLRCPTPRLHFFLSSHWPSLRFLSFMAFFIPSIQFFFGLHRALLVEKMLKRKRILCLYVQYYIIPLSLHVN
jgi:hypothetical protein